MTYQKVQFIGYQLYTGPATPTENPNDNYYVGLDDDIADIAKRVALMKDAIDTAYPKASTDLGTLKIFMAPEFYFRGKNGAYPISRLAGGDPDLDPQSLLGGLSLIAQEDKYKDWLFVFGTGLFHSVDHFNRYEAYNVAIVQKGSFATEQERLSKCVVCRKQFMSRIDFLKVPATGIRLHDVGHLMPLMRTDYDGELNTPGTPGKDGYSGGGIFVLDGITFGLEVCLDHAKYRLKFAWPNEDQYEIQIHLLPSGGMSILPPAAATCEGGYIFNVDGLNDTTLNRPFSAIGYHSDLCRAPETWPTFREDLEPIAPSTRVFQPAHQDLNQVKQVFWLPMDNSIPSNWPPSICLYPPLPIPAPMKA